MVLSFAGGAGVCHVVKERITVQSVAEKPFVDPNANDWRKGPPVIKVIMPEKADLNVWSMCVAYDASVVTNTSISRDYCSYGHREAKDTGTKSFHAVLVEKATFHLRGGDGAASNIWEAVRSTPITNWSKKVKLRWEE